MLYSIDSGKYVDKLPHKKDYDNWRVHISDADFSAVIDEINTQINKSDINTAGWIPGHDWTDTVYEPLYYACGRNTTQAGMFFGLIVFNLLMNENPNPPAMLGRME
ncbi:MAG: hypothetical protein PHN80_14605 [Hespellia sp.]|nr:hypothetical protein [Hespellia sp.]